MRLNNCFWFFHFSWIELLGNWHDFNTNLKRLLWFVLSAVLDEVDILFNDEDFELALQCLMNASPITAQYLFVTATLPIDIYNKLIEDFPDSNVIMGPGMHRTSAGLEEVISYSEVMFSSC